MPAPTTLPVVRTRAKIKADARALSGLPARAAAADEGEDSGNDRAGTVGEIWLYGVVGGYWFGFDAESVARVLRGMDVDEIVVRIHSPGGYAPDGIAIGNLLRNHKAKVTVVVDGLAASAASVIAIAGDEVIMCPGSQMMLHDASTIGWGNAAELRRAADWIDGQSQNYAGVYQYRAGGTVEHWREVMLANDGDGTWYTAEDTVSAGLADSVGTRTAVGSPPTAPDDGWEDDEEMLAHAEHDLQLLDACVHRSVRAAWRGEPPKPPTESSGGSRKNTTQEGSTAVAFSDEQLTQMRQELGLPEDADEATITAALSEALAERAEAPVAETPTPEIPEGHVVIPKAKLDDLEAGAAAGTAAARKLHDKEREDFLDANKTKYAPANRAAWSTEYDRDPVGTAEHFKTAQVIVPTEEIGHTDDVADAEDVTESTDYKNWSFA